MVDWDYHFFNVASFDAQAVTYSGVLIIVLLLLKYDNYFLRSLCRQQ